jgi:hypothetical protein
MGKAAQGMTVREEIDQIDSTLMEDIPFRTLLDEFTDIVGAEIEQG